MRPSVPCYSAKYPGAGGDGNLLGDCPPMANGVIIYDGVSGKQQPTVSQQDRRTKKRERERER